MMPERIHRKGLDVQRRRAVAEARRDEEERRIHFKRFKVGGFAPLDFALGKVATGEKTSFAESLLRHGNKISTLDFAARSFEFSAVQACGVKSVVQ